MRRLTVCEWQADVTQLFVFALRLGGGGARVPGTRNPGADQGGRNQRQAR